VITPTARQQARRAAAIQARAIRRAGVLLSEIPPGTGANQGEREGDRPLAPTRKQAATDAGLSAHQRKTALRVANVPARNYPPWDYLFSA
jgi:hypothetical protein